MLWIIASLFFFWRAFREVRRSIIPAPGFDAATPITKPYLAIVLTLSVLFAWPPVQTWYFERFLASKATQLADGHCASVPCNTLFDTMLDPEMLAAGHANPRTGKIVIQKPWCGILMSYLRHPGRATDEELASLDMFTHESMHMRGELNEAVTECEAVQPNYRAAELLGVADSTAKRNALKVLQRRLSAARRNRRTAGRLLFERMRTRQSYGRASRGLDLGFLALAGRDGLDRLSEFIATTF